jgi:hypothetical protein
VTHDGDWGGLVQESGVVALERIGDPVTAVVDTTGGSHRLLIRGNQALWSEGNLCDSRVWFDAAYRAAEIDEDGFAMASATVGLCGLRANAAQLRACGIDDGGGVADIGAGLWFGVGFGLVWADWTFDGAWVDPVASGVAVFQTFADGGGVPTPARVPRTRANNAASGSGPSRCRAWVNADELGVRPARPGTPLAICRHTDRYP